MNLKEKIKDLKVKFDTATKVLMGLDGTKPTEEQSYLYLISDSIENAELSPSEKAIKTAEKTVAMFQAYVHKAALLGTDPLTNLPNRSAFNEQIRTALEEQGTNIQAPNGVIDNDKRKVKVDENSNNYFALCFLDLDRFKGLNDDYGHDTGDAGLKAFATILNKIVREDKSGFFDGRGRVARLGGDEFTVILHTQAATHGEANEHFNNGIKRIRKALEAISFHHNGKNFPLASSIGMHVFEDNDTAENALKNSDKALFIDKETKGERYNFSVSSLTEQGVENLQTVVDKRAEGADLTKQQILNVMDNLIRMGSINLNVTKKELTAIIETATNELDPN